MDFKECGKVLLQTAPTGLSPCRGHCCQADQKRQGEQKTMAWDLPWVKEASNAWCLQGLAQPQGFGHFFLLLSFAV